MVLRVVCGNVTEAVCTIDINNLDMYDFLDLLGDELLSNMSARVPISAEVRISLWAYVAIRHIQRSDITRSPTVDVESHAIGAA